MYALTRSKPTTARDKLNKDDVSTTSSSQVIAPCPRYAYYQPSTLRAESPHPSIASVSAASLGCYLYSNERRCEGADDVISLLAVLVQNQPPPQTLPPAQQHQQQQQHRGSVSGATSIASLKKQQLQKEMLRLDRKLRHLDMKEASRKNRIKLQSASNSIATGKMSRLLSPEPSGESSTMAMTLSSNSDDITELKDLLQKEITIDHSRIGGGGEDEDSVCSDVTTPLTPQEELDRFLNSELQSMGEQELDEVSYSVRTTTTRMTNRPGLLETSSVVGSSLPVRVPSHRHSSKSQRSSRSSKSPKRSSGSKSPKRSKRPSHQSQRQMSDVGDAQPGRVKNMPWLLTFADERPPISALYTGPLQGGVPHGVGTFRYRSNGDMLYMGEINQGRMHGFGMFRTTSGKTTTTSGLSTIHGSETGTSSNSSGDGSGTSPTRRTAAPKKKSSFRRQQIDI